MQLLLINIQKSTKTGWALQSDVQTTHATLAQNSFASEKPTSDQRECDPDVKIWCDTVWDFVILQEKKTWSELWHDIKYPPKNWDVFKLTVKPISAADNRNNVIAEYSAFKMEFMTFKEQKCKKKTKNSFHKMLFGCNRTYLKLYFLSSSALKTLGFFFPSVD